MFEAFDPVLMESLVVLLEQQNYTRAAKKLQITQPALTQRIQKLERILRAKLVILSSDGLSLTDLGKKYFDEALVIQRALAQGVRRIRGNTWLSVAAEHEIISFFLLKPCRSFHKQWNLPLRLVTAIPKDAIVAVSNGECDLAVVDCADLPDNLAFQEIGRIAYHLVLAKDHPLLKKPSMNILDLNDQDFVAFSPYCQHRNWFDNVLGKFGIRAAIRLESVMSELIFEAVANGWGIALVPSFLPVPETCTTRHILDLPERQYFIVTQKNRMGQSEFHMMTSIIIESFRTYSIS